MHARYTCAVRCATKKTHWQPPTGGLTVMLSPTYAEHTGAFRNRFVYRHTNTAAHRHRATNTAVGCVDINPSLPLAQEGARVFHATLHWYVCQRLRLVWYCACASTAEHWHCFQMLSCVNRDTEIPCTRSSTKKD